MIAAAALAGSSCTAVVDASRPTWTAPGTFDYLAHDGGTTWGGGGPVTALVRGPDDLSLLTQCGPGGFENSVCQRHYDGTLTTQAGFTGDPGQWKVRMTSLRSCGVGGCDPLAIYLDQLLTPDGADGMTNPGITGALIDGTDGCSGRGVRFEGTGPLDSDPSIDVDVAIVICSPGLAAHMGATPNPI
jgi:hypothetical protein